MAVVVLLQLVGFPAPSGAGLGSGELCRVARYKAASAYLGCQAAALGREVNPATLVIGGLSDRYQKLAARCRAKYVQTRARWASALPGEPLCSGPRFVYGADGTIVDYLTGLVWELKTDDGGIHDKDNEYAWSAGGTASDGSLFTVFFATLNASPCFGGACDWRLPTMAELQTIMDPLEACAPCIDPNLGLYSPLPTWTATEDADFPDLVRQVSFGAGNLNNGGKASRFPVRAVRGGF